MNKNVSRLIFGSSLLLIAALAVAQRGGGSHSSGGGGYSGGSHSGGFSGGSGVSGTRSYSGGSTRSFGSGTRSSRGYSSGVGSRSTQGGVSRYSYSGSSSRGGSSGYQSRSTQGYSGRSQTRSNTGSGMSSYSHSANSSSSRYSARNSSVGESAFNQSHASESKSGGVNYRGNNNLNTGQSGVGRVLGGGSAPRGLLGPNSGVGRVIGGHDGFGYHGGWRSGYFGYWGGWRDSFFCFPFYCFDPFLAACYCSPWYYYPCLPPYVAAPNVVIEDAGPSNWSGNDYDWAPANRASDNPVLDNSVNDIVESFETDDHKAIDRLTAHNGNVKIDVDGKYAYSLKANDFYDTYVDGIESTKTDRYEILDVKANSDGTAKVVAKHVYNDPSGNRTYVYHDYFLVKEGDEYVIREFGTSNYRAD